MDVDRRTMEAATERSNIPKRYWDYFETELAQLLGLCIFTCFDTNRFRIDAENV